MRGAGWIKGFFDCTEVFHVKEPISKIGHLESEWAISNNLRGQIGKGDAAAAKGGFICVFSLPRRLPFHPRLHNKQKLSPRFECEGALHYTCRQWRRRRRRPAYFASIKIMESFASRFICELWLVALGNKEFVCNSAIIKRDLKSPPAILPLTVGCK